MNGDSEGKPTAVDASEHGLMRRTAAGDVEAFRRIFDRYYPLVYRLAHRITRRPELAEEAANDALFEVWRTAGRFRGESKVATWIYGISYFKALKTLHRRDDPVEDMETAEEEIDPADGPAEILEGRRLRGSVRSALGALTEAHRLVLEMSFFHGLTYAEIGRILGCPENTVKTRIFHAKKKLSRLLAPVVKG